MPSAPPKKKYGMPMRHYSSIADMTFRKLTAAASIRLLMHDLVHSKSPLCQKMKAHALACTGCSEKIGKVRCRLIKHLMAHHGTCKKAKCSVCKWSKMGPQFNPRKDTICKALYVEAKSRAKRSLEAATKAVATNYTRRVATKTRPTCKAVAANARPSETVATKVVAATKSSDPPPTACRVRAPASTQKNAARRRRMDHLCKVIMKCSRRIAKLRHRISKENRLRKLRLRLAAEEE